MNLKVSDAQREEGFTLIELLVVVIIIGILAAIAIPLFLNQRERAWIGTTESDVRNTAIEVETQATRGGAYPNPAAELDDDGIVHSADVTVEYAVEADGSAFTLCGTHERVDGVSIYSSALGGLSEEWQSDGTCPEGGTVVDGTPPDGNGDDEG